MKSRLTSLLITLALSVMLPIAARASTVYDNEADFFAAIGTKITDNYTNPGYVLVQTDAQMTSVLGETRYESTTFPNNDIVFQNGQQYNYCAGCNGGFNLYFTSTSLGTSKGVYGVGFLVTINDGSLLAYDLITFGDGSTDLLPMPTQGYFGITSDKLIAEMQMVDLNGQIPPGDGSWNLAITDLTIGASPIPEPGSILLLGSGFMGMVAALRKKLVS
ncbi:MAG: PEP-CTERM sorting domain-containing protein [Candidatus Korobacteraceae bacterium]